MVTGKKLGHPVRSLRTKFAREYAQKEFSDLPEDQLEALGIGALRKAVQDGNLDEGSFLCGQIAAMVKREEPAADIITDVVTGAEKVLEGASAWLK